MKLETAIKPRTCGTVLVERGDTKYLFKDEGLGGLTCDVDSKEDCKWLLSLGDYYPADEAESHRAARMVAEEEQDDEPEQFDIAPPPLEANTPKSNVVRKAARG